VLGLALVIPLASQAFREPIRAHVNTVGRPRIGMVERTLNEVRRRAEGEIVWEQTGAGASVASGDAMYVGTDSQAVVVLDDGGKITIDANSLVILEHDAHEHQAAGLTVAVMHGGAAADAAQHALALRAGQATLRLQQGGLGELRVGEDKRAHVQMQQGEASLVTRDQKTVGLAAGQAARVAATGEQTGPIQHLDLALLEPQRAETVYFADGDTTLVTFSWTPVSGPGSYVFELAKDDNFARPAAMVRVGGTEYRQRLSEGVFHWHVRRSDPRAAMISEERTLSVIRDSAPVIYRPRAEEAIDLTAPNAWLAWNQIRDVQHYVVQIAHDMKFATPFADVHAQGASQHLEGLEPRRYCARVRTEEPERLVTPWSVPLCFRVIQQPVLEAPRLFQPKREHIADPKTPAPGALESVRPDKQ